MATTAPIPSTPTVQPVPGYAFCAEAWGVGEGEAIWSVGYRAEPGRVRFANFSSASAAHEWAEQYRTSAEFRAELVAISEELAAR